MGLFDRKKEKARPDFSNVQRGGTSTAAAPVPISIPDLAPMSSATYVVVAGDSLSKIAKKHYGSASKWRAIYEANREAIKNPDLIYPGQELRIPAAEKA
jgi:nucleoid-associated protein YgaU